LRFKARHSIRTCGSWRIPEAKAKRTHDRVAFGEPERPLSGGAEVGLTRQLSSIRRIVFSVMIGLPLSFRM
jgi:hypothetical protein